MSRGLYLLLCLLGLFTTLRTGNAAEPRLTVMPDGVIYGNRSGPPWPLRVGIGDTVDQLADRNAFLASLKGKRFSLGLMLPMLVRLDVDYDDGDVRLRLPCAGAADLYGDPKYPKVGVALASFQLCSHFVNDWFAVADAAAEAIDRFRQMNSGATDLIPLFQSGDVGQIRKIYGSGWIEPRSPDSKILIGSVDRARERFRDEFPEARQGISGTAAIVGAFSGERTFVTIELVKSNPVVPPKEGQLVDVQYTVSISFRRRADVPFER